MKKRYHYRKRNNEYVLYDGTTILRNQFEEKICADNRDLAIKLAEALENGEDLQSPESILGYHNFYCTFPTVDADKMREMIVKRMTQESFEQDPFLCLEQEVVDRTIMAELQRKTFLHTVGTLNKYQLSAVFELHSVTNSWALSSYIIDEIVDFLNERPYEPMKEELLARIDGYVKWLMKGNPEFDMEMFATVIESLSKTIDSFVYYYSLKETD